MTNEVNRPSPTNIEAERVALGNVLLDNGAIPEVLWQLSAGDFHSERHRIIFAAMRSMERRNRAIDPLTLQEELVLSEQSGRAMMADVAALIDGVPRLSNLTEYIRQIKAAATKRAAIRLARWLENEAGAADVDAGELLSGLVEKVEELSAGQVVDDLISSGVAIERTMKNLEKRWAEGREVIGLSTGFPDLDKILLGLRPKLYTLAAATGLGKTTLALNIAHNVVSAGNQDPPPVGLIITLEMDVEELHVRALSTATRIDSYLIESGKLGESEKERVRKASALMAQLPIEYVEGFTSVTARSIAARVEKVRRKYKRLDFVIVDYLQLLDADDKHENEVARLTEITRTLKRISLKYHIPVIELSQLNRKFADRAKKDPVLSDLRASGSIEQDSDVVMFIAPTDYDHPEQPERRLIIAKQRGGVANVEVKLVFFGNQSRFESAAREQYPWEMGPKANGNGSYAKEDAMRF